MTDRPRRRTPRLSRWLALCVLTFAVCAFPTACATAPRDGPPHRIWLREEQPPLLRATPDGPDLRGLEVVPYLGWEPVLKFTRDHPEQGPVIFVAPEARYDEHGIPRKFGEEPRPSAYAPTGKTVENADGVWHEHVRTSPAR